jgi:serine/threonine-protein kinase HipA
MLHLPPTVSSNAKIAKSRVPQEDFCQVTGLPPERKYEEKGGPGISTILDILRGSDTPEADRENFLTTQLIFWLLAAPDGHAKNFSISIGPRGKFKLTPLYDVLSAWPIIGKGARHLQWQKAKLAMALHSKNTHYHMAEIQRRHWNAVAKNNGLGGDFEGVIQRILNLTPIVIDAVAAEIPHGFPSVVSESIFDGMRLQARRLSGH